MSINCREIHGRLKPRRSRQPPRPILVCSCQKNHLTLVERWGAAPSRSHATTGFITIKACIDPYSLRRQQMGKSAQSCIFTTSPSRSDSPHLPFLGVGHRATECFVFQVIAFVPAITIGVLTPGVRCGYIVPQIDYIMDNFTNRPPTLLEHIQQLLAPATRLSTDNTCASHRSHL